MKSKFNGSICKRCGQKIWQGTEIVKDNDLNAWVHEVCPRKKKSVGDTINDLSGRNFPKQVEDEQSLMPVNMDWTPSVYQQAIFNELESGSGNIVIEAVAGSGKTSTIQKGMDYVKIQKNLVMVLAFNKHIVKEFKSRVPEGTNVSTIHSLGLKLIKKLPEFKEIEEDKLDRIMEITFPVSKESGLDDNSRIQNRIKRGILRRVVSLAKATLVDYNNPDAILAMMERYNIDEDERVNTMEIVNAVPEIMKQCLEQIETIDFDDMQWIPVVHERLKNHFDKYMIVFVDEAQDLNNCQITFIKRLVYPEGRIVCVGDRHQSLYGFRGADTEAIPRLIDELKAETLPLSITYRCPSSHVELAKAIVPHIEASETANVGEVIDIEYDEFIKKTEPGDMVICRTNAPLVKPAFETIRQGKKAIIRGRDIGAQLVNFVERFNAQNLNELEVMMLEFTTKEVNRLIDRGKEVQASYVQDKYDTVIAISKVCKSVPELVNKLDMLFSDSNNGVVFSSVHRAKGLEAERVFILRRDLMPFPKAREGWEMTQEKNVEYVALTRSKNILYFVNGE